MAEERDTTDVMMYPQGVILIGPVHDDGLNASSWASGAYKSILTLNPNELGSL